MVTASEQAAPSATIEKPAPYGGATPRGKLAGSRFTISADKIMAATADLPERDRLALRWAHSYCVAKNLSHADLAAKLKQPTGEAYSKDSLYHAFTGGREPEQLKNVVTAIESLKRIEEERAELVDSGYLHTSIGKRIWRVCRRALLRRRIGFIFGDTQIGKTESVEAYMRVPEHNHGQTKYFRFPAGGAYCDVLREMALMLGLATGNNGMDLRRMIIDSFDEHMLLIADEIMESQSMTSGSVKRYLRTINFLREIHDRKKCGLVLVGTNVFRDAIARIEEMFSKPKAALLIKTVKTIRKKGLNALPTDELRKIGCSIIAAGDHVYIAPVADDVDKLVTRMLKADSIEEDAE